MCFRVSHRELETTIHLWGGGEGGGGRENSCLNLAIREDFQLKRENYIFNLSLIILNLNFILHNVCKKTNKQNLIVV